MSESIADLLASLDPTQDLVSTGLDLMRASIRVNQGMTYDEFGRPNLKFVAYVDLVNPRFVWHRHNLEVAIVLQGIIDGKYGRHARVIIAEPPRHGKTEQVSKMFTGYWLLLHPEQWVGLCTYVAELAYTVSNSARAYYQIAGGTVTAEAAREWHTGKGGGMWAAGVGGPITGKGFNLGLIDDPVKNAEESRSETIGERNREWYQSTFYTREAQDEEQTAIIVMHTRWPGPGDLIGWLLEQEGLEDEHPEKWHVVSLEAMKEEEAPVIPETCTLHPDWRQPGEALCPGRFGEERLHKIKRRVGPYFWASIFQQRPRPREGGAFKESWFSKKIESWQVPPRDAMHPDVRYWDLGGSEKGAGGDPTVSVHLRYVGKGQYIIMHAQRFFLTPGARDRLIRQTAEQDFKNDPTLVQWGPQDPAAAGKSDARHFRANLEGLGKVYTELVGGDIETLSGAYQSALENGDYQLVRGEWNAGFINEHLEAWTGAHDDYIWAAGNAHQKLINGTRRRAARRAASHSAVNPI